LGCKWSLVQIQSPRLNEGPEVLRESEGLGAFTFRRLDSQAFVRFDTNRYSVPTDHADRALTLVADDVTVRVLDGAT